MSGTASSAAPTFSLMSLTDKDFAEFDFTANLSDAGDLITGTPTITFDPVGPAFDTMTITSDFLKVIVQISGCVPPGNWVRCDVVTSSGRNLTRSRWQPVEQL